MTLYTFISRDKDIILVYNSNGNTKYFQVGDIYNLVDYINYNIDTARIDLINFTGDKIDFIIKAITRYKSITNVLDYNSIVITNKKRVRGRKL